MTVQVQPVHISYFGDGTTVVFPFPFRVLEAAHLKVYIDDVLQAGNYSVAGVGDAGGGNVTFTVSPPNGTRVDLLRLVERTQLVDYRPFDPFPAETHERALDKLTMMMQEDQDLFLRAVRADAKDPERNMILPSPTARANMFLAFDSAGNVVVSAGSGAATSHSTLLNLTADDHPQYHTDARGVRLDGGVPMTGPLTLFGTPTQPLHAASKSYVDTFVGGAKLTNYISNATGDAQLTVQAAWNAQANALGITRTLNEFIHYRWPSGSPNVYRYMGNQVGPAGWASTAADWPQTLGITEAPSDGLTYGRRNNAWIDIQPAIDAKMAAHVAAADPHAQYLLINGSKSMTGRLRIEIPVSNQNLIELRTTDTNTTYQVVIKNSVNGAVTQVLHSGNVYAPHQYEAMRHEFWTPGSGTASAATRAMMVQASIFASQGTWLVVGGNSIEGTIQDVRVDHPAVDAVLRFRAKGAGYFEWADWTGGVSNVISKDRARLTNLLAGTGVRLESLNVGATDFEPIVLRGESVEVNARNGVLTGATVTKTDITGIQFPTDNTYDIGALGATRPRDVHIGRNLFVAGAIAFGSLGATTFTGPVTINDAAAPVTTSFSVGAAGSDFFRVRPQTAGNGSRLETRDPANTDFSKFDIVGNPLDLYGRTTINSIVRVLRIKGTASFFDVAAAIGAAPAGLTVANQTNTSATADVGGTSHVQATTDTLTVSGANNFLQIITQSSNLTIAATAGTTSTAICSASTMTLSNAMGVTNARIFQAGYTLNNTGSIGAATGFLVSTPNFAAAGSVTSMLGFFCSNLGHATLVTNAIGFDAANMTSASGQTASFRSAQNTGANTWGFYHTGTANNAFNGNVRIGGVTAPTVTLDVTGNQNLSGNLIVDTNTLVVDATADRVIIGHTAGISGVNQSRFQIHGTTQSTGSETIFVWNGTNAGPSFDMAKSKGVGIGTHTAVALADQLGIQRWAGSTGVDFVTGAQFRAISMETWSATNSGASLEWAATPIGATGISPALLLGSADTGAAYLGVGTAFNVTTPILPQAQLHIANVSTGIQARSEVRIQRGANIATLPPMLSFYKNRGNSIAAPTALTAGDDVGLMSWFGHVGATGGFVEGARIFVDEVGAIADNANGLGMTMEIHTRATGGALTKQWTFSETGALLGSNPAGGLGYGTGTGGTVVQATSKATAVALNRLTGEITMNAANLAADTSVTFQLTNTSVLAGDFMAVQHVSAGTLGAYKAEAICTAGVATITVRNVSPGALAEAIVLKFINFRAVTA